MVLEQLLPVRRHHRRLRPEAERVPAGADRPDGHRRRSSPASSPNSPATAPAARLCRASSRWSIGSSRPLPTCGKGRSPGSASPKNEVSSYGKSITETRMVPVIVSLLAEDESVQRRNGMRLRDIKREAVARACLEIDAQGGCVTGSEFAIILPYHLDGSASSPSRPSTPSGCATAMAARSTSAASRPAGPAGGGAAGVGGDGAQLRAGRRRTHGVLAVRISKTIQPSGQPGPWKRISRPW